MKSQNCSDTFAPKGFFYFDSLLTNIHIATSISNDRTLPKLCLQSINVHCTETSCRFLGNKAKFVWPSSIWRALLPSPLTPKWHDHSSLCSAKMEAFLSVCLEGREGGGRESIQLWGDLVLFVCEIVKIRFIISD